MSKIEKKINQAYDRIAKPFFNSRVTKKAVYNEYLEMPAMLSILGDLKGKKVLDLGCGPGLHSARLLKQGAILYGIDQSEKMISIAKSYVKGADFQVGTVYSMPYKSGFFDVVFASYVVHYFTDLDKALKEVRRVLKKGGIFAFSTTNPFKEMTHRLPGRPYYVRKFENYFDEGPYNLTWFKNTKNQVTIPFVHWTFESYIKSALRTGFEIIDYADAKPLPKMKEVNKRVYEVCAHIPQLSIFKLKAV
ncbi:MAG: methyltransferase domain-containing protein [Candidatus Micrarchaeia archaeon]